MNMQSILTPVVAAALLLTGLDAVPSLSGATSLRGNGSPEGAPDSSPKAATMTKTEVVKKHVDGCRKKPAKEANCDKLQKDAVEILKEDLHTGSSLAHLLNHYEVVERRLVADCGGCDWLIGLNMTRISARSQRSGTGCQTAVAQMISWKAPSICWDSGRVDGNGARRIRRLTHENSMPVAQSTYLLRQRCRTRPGCPTS
jgi:hypothetical protein